MVLLHSHQSIDLSYKLRSSRETQMCKHLRVSHREAERRKFRPRCSTTQRDYRIWTNIIRLLANESTLCYLQQGNKFLVDGETSLWTPKIHVCRATLFEPPYLQSTFQVRTYHHISPPRARHTVPSFPKPVRPADPLAHS